MPLQQKVSHASEHTPLIDELIPFILKIFTLCTIVALFIFAYLSGRNTHNLHSLVLVGVASVMLLNLVVYQVTGHIRVFKYVSIAVMTLFCLFLGATGGGGVFNFAAGNRAFRSLPSCRTDSAEHRGDQN